VRRHIVSDAPASKIFMLQPHDMSSDVMGHPRIGYWLVMEIDVGPAAAPIAFKSTGFALQFRLQ
jgi:hypothetical protein